MKKSALLPWIVEARLILALLFLEGSCIHMKSVEVPDHTPVSSIATLRCNYHLGKDKLYSVKWYKDSSEFYRYVPRDNPHSQVFIVPGIRVDQRASNDRKVVLRDISLDSSGVYACEASSEAPRFKTVSGQKEMSVVDLPDSKPLITGANPRGYKVGQLLDVNCSSPNSKPPAELKWYINNEMVDPNYLMQQPPFRSTQRGLYTSALRLRFQLRRNHFHQGHVAVKCTATIYSEYFESSEYYLPGLGLGEKALESYSRGTNGAFYTANGSSDLFITVISLLSWRRHGNP